MPEAPVTPATSGPPGEPDAGRVRPNVVVECGRLAVSPGGEARMPVRITNLSRVVDTYRVTIVGDALVFATAEPADVALFPGTDGESTIVFRPPAGTRVAGPVPVGIKVSSSLDPRSAAVEEAELDVAGAVDLVCELRPRRVEARRKSRHHITVENTGNVVATITLAASDADELLRFKLRPALLTLGPGDVARARVRVKALTGSAGAMRPFIVTVAGEGAPPKTVDGALFQRGGRPAWLVPAVMALALLGVLGFVLYSKGNIKARTATSVDLASKTEDSTTTVATSTSVVGVTSTTMAVGDGGGGGGGPGPSTTVGRVPNTVVPVRSSTTSVLPPVPFACTLPGTVPSGNPTAETAYLQCAWENGNLAAAARVATPAGVTSLFTTVGHYSSPAPGSVPNCAGGGAAGSTFCTVGYHNRTLQYQYDNASSKIVAVVLR